MSFKKLKSLKKVSKIGKKNIMNWLLLFLSVFHLTYVVARQIICVKKTSILFSVLTFDPGYFNIYMKSGMPN